MTSYQLSCSLEPDLPALQILPILFPDIISWHARDDRIKDLTATNQELTEVIDVKRGLDYGLQKEIFLGLISAIAVTY